VRRSTKRIQDTGFRIQEGALEVFPGFLAEAQDSGVRIQGSAIMVVAWFPGKG
jgi:hypothetical protein